MYPCQTVIYSASGLSAWGLLTKSGRSLTGSKCYFSTFCSVLVEYSHSLAANRDYDATLRNWFEYQVSKCCTSGEILPYMTSLSVGKISPDHTVLLETDVRRSDFVVIFFNGTKTGQP